jgi:hypothetical protein
MTSFGRLLWFAVSFSFSILLWGCLEYNITTQVMTDGSIMRTIIVKGDSADIFRGSFRVPVDSTWTISTKLEPRNKKDSTDGDIYVYEARKKFRDVKELNKAFYSDSSFSDHLSINVRLDKKFRWFYTFYRYTETYNMLFPFRSEPLSSYMNENELSIFLADENEIYYSPERDSILFKSDTTGLPVLTGKDSLRFKEIKDELDHKFELWQKSNVYNDFYETVTGALEKLGKMPDNAATRELFYQHLDSSKVFDQGIENFDAFIEAVASYFNVDYSILHEANKNGFDSFRKKFKVATFSLETYTNQVMMPGLIVNTNAHEKEVDQARWNFKIDNFYACNYVMAVESRIVNKWIILFSALALIFAVGLSLAVLFKKKKTVSKDNI